MTALRLTLLGDIQMRDAADALVTISAKKSQALLAYFGVKPATLVSRDKIAALLWSSTAQEQARQSLRQTLSTLRKELAQISATEKILVEEGDYLRLDPAAVEVDVVAFEAALAANTEESLRQACTLYRGDFLDGFQIQEERFDQWVLAERDRLHRSALKAHAQLSDLQMKRGAIDEAINTAQQSLRIDPLQEPVHRSLMRLFTQSGDLLIALQQYDVLAKTLRRELRTEPDAETRSVYQQIVQLRANRGATDDGEQRSEKQTVLVVEDNLLSRELTSAVLKSAGYEVRVASDGADALLLLGRESVDLVLMDIDLPFIDGHSVLQALKEKGHDVPAIFISGLPGEEPEIKAFEVGASDFIRKPVKNNVLLARVARVLKPEV